MRRHHGRAPSPYAGRTATPPSADVSLIRNFDFKINPTKPVRQSPLATSQIQGMPLDLIERVRSFPLFQSAPATFLAEVGMMLKPQMHAVNDYIMTEGEEAKAMYWIVRGAVAVTSRDGESTYAELKPGAFIGEIGILLARPRTATVVAQTRCLTLQLKKEDLHKLLPGYPDIEQRLREEALERLAILERKKRQQLGSTRTSTIERRGSKRTREPSGDDMEVDGVIKSTGASKRRKSPSPGTNDVSSASALGHGLVNVRALLKELPLFANLPAEMLHFLGLNAQPQTFVPFQNVIKQDTTGREVFFIVRGEVEVLDEYATTTSEGRKPSYANGIMVPRVKARLKAGSYFGEVVSLSLADRRTATVRCVNQVECLVITENVLAEFWRRCPVDVKQQIEDTAKERLRAASENDVIMKDASSAPDMNELVIGDGVKKRIIKQPPRVAFNDPEISSPHELPEIDESTDSRPLDPDPFKSVGLENVRLRSRRSSLAPSPPDEPPQAQRNRRSPRHSPSSSPVLTSPSSMGSRSATSSPVSEAKPPMFAFGDPFALDRSNRRRMRPSPGASRGQIPDTVLPLILQHLPLQDLFRVQGVSYHWQTTLQKSPLLFHDLDLSVFNRKITNELLIHHVAPFVGPRPRYIDISNCFHVGDNGFAALALHCAANVRTWRMKSVWDVTAPAILEMSNRAPNLKEIDLSNCRKVSDTLLARIVGWVVPNSLPSISTLTSKSHHNRHRSNSSDQKRPSLNTRLSQSTIACDPNQPAPGTTFGCQSLSTISLSYCKHITDRTMHHIASHAAGRLEEIDLTRCTTITDLGFQYWGNAKFERLRKLCLADCTYLSDQAIVWLVNGAGVSLQELDLSFCCALSDTSLEVLSLSAPRLTHLNLAFCGSAVSDSSLRSISHHLTSLRGLSVRGCVRVTGIGIESIIEGCWRMETLDVSQCKNLAPWIDAGGIQRCHARGKTVNFVMVR